MADLPSVQLIELHERESRIFPRMEFVDAAGKSLLHPGVRSLTALELKDVDTGIQLRALGLVGHIPVTERLVLHVRPKFPIPNFWSLLAGADEKYERVLSSLRGYGGSSEAVPENLLTRAFSKTLGEILTSGVVKSYMTRAVRGYFQPKVNFGRTVARCIARGNDLETDSDVSIYSADHRSNRLLKSACIAFLLLMPRQAGWETERLVLLDGLNALENVSDEPMHAGGLIAVQSLPIWVRPLYERALGIYSILLGFSNVGFAYDAEGKTLPSFLFSLDSIFENYVRNCFREALRLVDVKVLDGNTARNSGCLFVDNKRFCTKPDLIFRKGAKLLGLAEVKYKPKVDDGDRYQLISHVTAAGSLVGVWISPALDGNGGIEYIGALPTGAKFYHYRLPLSQDLKHSTDAMIEIIGGLLGCSAP